MKPGHFSYYKAPIQNLLPHSTISLKQLHKGIAGTYFRARTKKLRELTGQEAKAFKTGQLDFVTFSGIFTRRKSADMIQTSGLMCLDFDHLGDSLPNIRYNLLNDDQLPPALLFTSPSGSGLKLVLETDLKQANHKEWFTALSFYYHQTYCLEVEYFSIKLILHCTVESFTNTIGLWAFSFFFECSISSIARYNWY